MTRLAAARPGHAVPKPAGAVVFTKLDISSGEELRRALVGTLDSGRVATL
jgi:hypothetical protein